MIAAAMLCGGEPGRPGADHRHPGVLPAPRPRDLHPVRALRPADLPGLHDVGLGRLPVPGVRGRGGGQWHLQGRGHWRGGG